MKPKGKTRQPAAVVSNPNLINDGLILSEKCKRDIAGGVTLFLDYYLAEFNRILETACREQPDIIKDIAPIRDESAGKRATARGQVKLQTLYTVDAAIDKLVSRLTVKFKELERARREETDFLPALATIFGRFHQVVRQLRSRHDGRPTLDVGDEHDIRDLTRALLSLHFEEVGTVTRTPAYGTGEVTDFHLPAEETVIIVKKSGEELRHRQVEEQITADIAHYAEQPGCGTLVFFVYDPDGMVAYPASLENHLSTLSSDRLTVKVYINPK